MWRIAGQLRIWSRIADSVKKFVSWILNELRVVDLRTSLVGMSAFLHNFWDVSFFLPKILKMSMSFTVITFASL